MYDCAEMWQGTCWQAVLLAPMAPLLPSLPRCPLRAVPSAGFGETFCIEIHQSVAVTGCGCAAAPAMTAWCLSGKEVMFSLEDVI